MSIATNGIGNNPATESRIAYDYATAARSVKAVVTDTEAGSKTSAKKNGNEKRSKLFGKRASL